MNATPSPTSRRSLLAPEAVSDHRSIYCPEYDDCLAMAVRAGWRSWSCEHCPRAREVTAPRADAFAISGA